MINLYSLRPKGFNVGNDVIYLAVNHFVRKVFKESYNVVSLPATSKYEAHRKAGINSQTVYEINQFGNGVIIGGGNLYENGELEVNPIALKALDKPMMIFSVSRGKIYNKDLRLVDRTDVMTDNNIKLINDKAVISLSRDKSTKEYIDGLGCNNVLGGCPTLFLNEMPQHMVPILEKDKTDALISIRTPTLMSIPVSYQYELRGQVISIIELLKRKGYSNVKLLCHDHRDIPYAASFASLGVDYLYSDDVYTFLSYLKSTKLNVTFRLHSFLPCLSLDIPTIKISYDERALSIINDTLDLGEWNINLLKDDLLKELELRIDNLPRLEELKNERKGGLWNDIRTTIINGCETFAQEVYKTI